MSINGRRQFASEARIFNVTHFLMPEKFVRASFESQFASECFALNEETVFALTGSKSSGFQERCQTLRDLSLILAKAEYYNGLYFTSLSDQFRVSAEAMAIRLEELELLVV
jgi:Zn-dependent peptidase ImmA (M78 family)